MVDHRRGLRSTIHAAHLGDQPQTEVDLRFYLLL
jgi:hypothetical protein